MLKQLADKFSFYYKIIQPSTFIAAVRLVGTKSYLRSRLNQYYFQSSNRDADLMLVRGLYREGIALKNDYIGPTGAVNLRFLSSTPQQIPNYLTLINPYDGYIWAFLLASVVAVIFSLIIIDTNYADWTKTSKKDIIYQSKC